LSLGAMIACVCVCVCVCVVPVRAYLEPERNDSACVCGASESVP
jgi:hypothetical protein